MQKNYSTVYAVRNISTDIEWTIETASRSFSEIENEHQQNLSDGTQLALIYEREAGDHYSLDMILKVEPARMGWWKNFNTGKWLSPNDHFEPAQHPFEVNSFKCIFDPGAYRDRELTKEEYQAGYEDAEFRYTRDSNITFEIETTLFSQTNSYELTRSEQPWKSLEDVLANTKADKNTRLRLSGSSSFNHFYIHVTSYQKATNTTEKQGVRFTITYHAEQAEQISLDIIIPKTVFLKQMKHALEENIKDRTSIRG